VRYRYQINAKTELAQRYNNVSPLENHHSAVAIQILANAEYNIFSNVSQQKQRYIHDVSGLAYTCPPAPLVSARAPGVAR